MCAAVYKHHSCGGEQQLNESSASLEDALSQIRDGSRLWVIENGAFLSLTEVTYHRFCPLLVMRFINNYLHSETVLVYGRDLESAAHAATYVLSKRDVIFDSVWITSNDSKERENVVLPLSSLQLNSIFESNSQRQYHFENFTLTAQQGWTMSSTDLLTRLSFVGCHFLDGGETFCQGSATRSACYDALSFEQTLPFHEESWCNLCQILDHDSAEHVNTLSLRYIAFEGNFSSFSIPRVKKLTIECCFFSDPCPMDCLIDAVRMGCIQHSLTLSGIACSYDVEQWHYEKLLEAVGTSDIQQLSIVGAIDEDDYEWLSTALIRILDHNKKLKTLILGEYQLFGGERWEQLLKTIAKHPSLVLLECETLGLDVDMEHLLNHITPAVVSLLQERSDIQVSIPLWILEDDFDIDFDDALEENLSFICPSTAWASPSKISDDTKKALHLLAPFRADPQRRGCLEPQNSRHIDSMTQK